eukprot:473325_1
MASSEQAAKQPKEEEEEEEEEKTEVSSLPPQEQPKEEGKDDEKGSGAVPSSHQGFYIQIINATPFQLKRVKTHEYQMDTWSFPPSIAPNSIGRGYAEWGGGAIWDKMHDDGADVIYEAHTSTKDGATIHIHCEYPGGIKVIYGQASNNDGAKWVFFPPPSKKDDSNSAKLGWIHDGCLSVGIVFNKNGFSFPNGEGYYVESYDYANQPANYLKRSAKQFGSDWMKRYWPCINNLSLNELTIPGTHDTATFAKPEDGITTLWVRTQSQDINQQLMWGMRAFDLRLYNTKKNGTDSDRFIMSHGKYKLELKLTDVLGSINSYCAKVQFQSIILDFHRFNNNWDPKDYDDMITLVFDTLNTANCIPYYSDPKPIGRYKPKQQIVVAIDKSLFSDKIKQKYAQYLWPKIDQQWDEVSVSGFDTIKKYMNGILDPIKTDKQIRKDLWSFQCAYNQVGSAGAPAYVPEEISMYFSGINCIKSNIVNMDFICETTTSGNVFDDETNFPNFSNLMNAVPTNILKGFRKGMGYSLI